MGEPRLRMGPLISVVLATTVPAALTLQRPAGAPLNFVGCPIVRDTATVPCWLAEHQGELYFLGSQGSTSSAFYPPQLLHEVLVEARVGTGPRICGGLPLQSVEVSVMAEINRSCNTILPAEPQYTTPASPPAPIPAFADTTREFDVMYDFDSDYLTLHTTRVVLEAVRIAKLARTERVEIAARTGATQLWNRRVLTERAGLADLRAQHMREHLTRLGLSASGISLSVRTTPEPVRALDGIAPRHLTIRLKN